MTQHIVPLIESGHCNLHFLLDLKERRVVDVPTNLLRVLMVHLARLVDEERLLHH